MDIVCCIDQNYIMQCGVMLYSVCVNNRNNDITFHVVVDEKVSEVQKQSLRNIVKDNNKQIKFYLVRNSDVQFLPNLDSSNPQPWVSAATYYRLFLPQILPETISKVIYLDCDVLVRHDLREFWDIELKEQAVACVPDCNENKVAQYNRLQYPESKGYFNAGILLVNLQFWRENYLQDVFMDFLTNHKDRIRLHDQDVLNYTLQDRKQIVHLTWNFQEDFLKHWLASSFQQRYARQWEEALTNPFIVHFTGSQKPWFSDCQHPLQPLYLAYRSQTQWKNQPLRNSICRLPFQKKIKRYAGNFLRRFHLLKELDYGFMTVKLALTDFEKSITS